MGRWSGMSRWDDVTYYTDPNCGEHFLRENPFYERIARQKARQIKAEYYEALAESELEELEKIGAVESSWEKI